MKSDAFVQIEPHFYAYHHHTVIQYEEARDVLVAP